MKRNVFQDTSIKFFTNKPYYKFRLNFLTMKKIFILPILGFAFILFGFTNCTKVEDTMDAELFTEQRLSDVKTAIIGSWQIIEKGVEVVMHDEHICSGTANSTTSANTTTLVKWENATSLEKRDFRQNGDYNQSLTSALTCQGTYKIANNEILDVTTNCQISSEKIAQLTSHFLTVKEGNRFFKYRKLN